MNHPEDTAHLDSIDMNHLRSIDYQNIQWLSAKSQDESAETSLIDLEQNTDILLDDANNLIQNLFQIIHQLQRHRGHVLSHHSRQYNMNTNHQVHKINEDASMQEVKDEDVEQADNGNIFDKLNEFTFEYNENRPANCQINRDAVIRCFRENDMDYTDYKDLNSNLKQYGIPAGAVRKLWRFLNPVEMNENDQDNEDVVIIPAGSYIYNPSEYDHILFENTGEYDDLFIDHSNLVSLYALSSCTDFKIGENLSVPSDWSDGD